MIKNVMGVILQILILDEPTVGVDPLLRQRIWDHLVGISSTNNTTIIITTHYIEEARLVPPLQRIIMYRGVLANYVLVIQVELRSTGEATPILAI